MGPSRLGPCLLGLSPSYWIIYNPSSGAAFITWVCRVKGMFAASDDEIDTVAYTNVLEQWTLF